MAALGTVTIGVTVTGVKDVALNTIGGSNTASVAKPDTIAPTVSSLAWVDTTHLKVTFNEAVDLATAQTFGNYAFDNGITASAAVRGGAGNDEVTVTTSNMAALGTVTIGVTVTGVKDVALNTIGGSNTASVAKPDTIAPTVSSLAWVDTTHLK